MGQWSSLSLSSVCHQYASKSGFTQHQYAENFIYPCNNDIYIYIYIYCHKPVGHVRGCAVKLTESCWLCRLSGSDMPPGKGGVINSGQQTDSRQTTYHFLGTFSRTTRYVIGGQIRLQCGQYGAAREGVCVEFDSKMIASNDLSITP